MDDTFESQYSTSGTWYQASTNLNPDSSSQCVRLTHPDGIQYIERRPSYDLAKGTLLYSGKFHSDGVVLKLNAETGLLTSRNSYIAMVAIEPVHVDALDRATTFQSAKAALRQNMQIVRVLCDQQREQANASSWSLNIALLDVRFESLGNLQNAEDLFQLNKILANNCKDPGSRAMLREISGNLHMSDRLKAATREYVEKHTILETRDRLLSTLTDTYTGTSFRGLFDALKSAEAAGLKFHREKVLEKCPSFMRENLTKITGESILFVTASDLKLLAEVYPKLESFMPESITHVFADRYVEYVNNTKEDHLTGVIPFASRTYHWLCKILIGTAELVKTQMELDGFLQYGEGQLEVTTPFTRLPRSQQETSLVQQLELLVSWINHFGPEKCAIDERSPYEFTFYRRLHPFPNLQEPAQDSAIENITSDLLHVWISLLDDAMSRAFPCTLNNIQLFPFLLEVYVNLSSTTDSLEEHQQITQDTLHFVFRTGSSMQDRKTLDKDVFKKQMNFINCLILDGKMFLDDYRDLLGVFSTFWVQQSAFASSLESKLPEPSFETNAAKVGNLVLHCLAQVLDCKLPPAELIKFCRAYCDVLIGFNTLELDWYLRPLENDFLKILLLGKVLHVVDNKWKNSAYECYRVANAKKFSGLHQVLCKNYPKPRHYQVDVIKTFLQLIDELTAKRNWTNDSGELSALVLLMSSIKSSVPYLNQQPDHECFDKFFKEFTKPLRSAIDDSKSFDEFSEKVLLIKESFWYSHNLNANDIDNALELCTRSNFSFEESHLRTAFRTYSDQFDSYIKLSKVKVIVLDVKKTVKTCSMNNWTFDIKQNNLPRVLAGLAAVWSIQKSRDMKPHCVQILCILRQLGADCKNTGVKQHCAQVLAGQGKSLILGLTATVLAFFGHRVRVLCQTKYLAERDDKEFKELHQHFSVSQMIFYDTQLSSIDKPNVVLLIDEMEEFFNSGKLHPLILGVTGSFSTSHSHRNHKHPQTSVMPTCFSGSFLKFNPKNDLTCVKTGLEWTFNIFNRVFAAIKIKRSVLVVFESDAKLNQFVGDLFFKLSRSNILTASTDMEVANDVIRDAGVTQMITLATREMALGVDYRSSSVVEQNGGIHVIQTFFSLQDSEEALIQGRTARRCNDGSYEL